MKVRLRKCVNCDCATYKAAKDCKVEDCKRGELCLYCTKHNEVIEEDWVCDNWTPVKGDIW